MREMIEERRQSASEGGAQADLFTNLINGTSLDMDEKAVDQLSDEELMGMGLLVMVFVRCSFPVIRKCLHFPFRW